MMHLTILKALRSLSLRHIAIALAMAWCLSASARHIHFFSSDSQLSSSLINKVLYDSNGFLWVATEDGLNRFDGSRFNIYRHVQGDSTSLADNYVTTIFEDDRGNLLVATYVGVQIYDPSTDSFSPLDPETLNDRGYSVSDIEQMPDGRIVLGGQVLVEGAVASAGVIRYKKILHSDPGLAIKKIEVDRAGGVWFTSNLHGGLSHISSDGYIKHYLDYADAPEPLSICLTDAGDIFVGTQECELLRYDPKNDAFHSVGRAGAPIISLLSSADGILLVGTDGAGITAYNPLMPQAGLFELPFVDSQSKTQKIHSLDYDEYGNLWIGVYQKGLVMVPARTDAFNNLGRDGLQSKIIGDACVTSVFVDEDGTLWVGTDYDGIYRVSPDRMHSKHFPPSASLPSVINKFYTDVRGDLWVASYDKGLGRLDRNTGAYRRLDIRDAQGRAVNRVFDILEGADGNMYIATMGSGLYRYDGNGRVEPFETPDGYNAWITYMARDEDSGRLYFGSYDGVFEVEGNRVKQLAQGMIITSLLVDDKSQTLWAGTNRCLLKIKLSTGESEKIEGPIGGMVHAVESDGHNLWISSNSGLYMYDVKSGAIVNFNYNDGLQGNEFYKGASCIDRDGCMYFGGINGVTYFDPRKIEGFSKPADVRITRFYVGAHEIKAGARASGEHPVTDLAVFQADTFRLASTDDSFSLDFNLRNPFAHAAPAFYYSLDGGEWQQIPVQNAASYSQGGSLSFSHLPSGTHQLSLKAVDKGAESQVRTVSIVIDPAWFATPWAKMLYLLVALGCIVAGILIMRHRQRLRMLKMQHLHEEEVKEGKLQFFTNVSHEIKTPMSLVIGPVEQLIAEDDDPRRQQIYRTILRNSNRILRLVNEIMDLRRIDKNMMDIQLQRVQMVDFIMDLYRTFEPAAAKKEIDLTFQYAGCEDLEAYIDVENFDKVVMNLLSNAIKYTPKGGSVEIRLEADQPTASNPKVRLMITDTGVGISAKDREHIFDRFYRVADNFATGTGIGLHLASRLMALHKGTLTVEDNPAGKGSRFIAEWPLKPEKAEAAAQLTPKPAAEARKMPVAPIDDIDVPDRIDGDGIGKRRAPIIYIVEDDNEIASYLAEQLSADNWVETFENGRQALDAIHRQIPNLVISDVMMPVMDGLTLTRKIRDNINLNHIPVILLTAKTREQDVVEGFDCGADDYISKPFNMSILQKKVKSLLSTHARLRNVYSGKQDLSDKVDAPEAIGHDEQLLERVLKVISANLSNSDITIETIAQEIGISRVHLHRKLKNMTNQTTRDFVRNIRLQKAAEIMQKARLNVSEISIMVGFKSPNSFATVFKEMYGMTPSEYMAMHHDTAN